MKYLSQVLTLTLAVVFSNAALAARAGDFEYSFYIPFSQSETIDFTGGAKAEIQSDAGFGFSIAQNTSEQLTLRFDVSWNSANYTASRVLDDGAGTIERYSNRLDSFNMGVGGDYYLTNGKIAPYVSGNLGWSWIDTNIPTGNSSTICWWDPWWGYICSSSLLTYETNDFYYGAGAGLRLNLNRNSFVRLGYYENWRNIDYSSGSPGLGTIRLEFGASY